MNIRGVRDTQAIQVRSIVTKPKKLSLIALKRWLTEQ
jgi:hypothetical protein